MVLWLLQNNHFKTQFILCIEFYLLIYVGLICIRWSIIMNFYMFQLLLTISYHYPHDRHDSYSYNEFLYVSIIMNHLTICFAAAPCDRCTNVPVLIMPQIVQDETTSRAPSNHTLGWDVHAQTTLKPVLVDHQRREIELIDVLLGYHLIEFEIWLTIIV